MHRSGAMPDAVALAPGSASGPTLVLEEPLSFWGGVDPDTGVITDTHHPQHGASVAGRVVMMPAARGSSSSASVLAETIRNGHGPGAILLAAPDPILALGAFVAAELYGIRTPIAVLDPVSYAACAAAARLEVAADESAATVHALSGPSPTR